MSRELRVGQGFRDLDKRESGQRVVFVTGLDFRYAYVRSETEPHRRSRILRSRLASSAFEFVGEMGRDPSVWPDWFKAPVIDSPPKPEQLSLAASTQQSGERGHLNG